MSDETKKFPIEDGFRIEDFIGHGLRNMEAEEVRKMCPFDEMKTGQSFLLPFDYIDENQRLNISAMCSNMQKRTEKIFSYRMDSENGGRRIWRIEWPRRKEKTG